MEMKQCAKGHFYDASIHTQCPYCNTEESGATQPLDVGRTVPVNAGQGGAGHTVAMNAGRAGDDGRTISVIKKEIGDRPGRRLAHLRRRGRQRSRLPHPFR